MVGSAGLTLVRLTPGVHALASTLLARTTSSSGPRPSRSSKVALASGGYAIVLVVSEGTHLRVTTLTVSPPT
jgi:hypothetical protein